MVQVTSFCELSTMLSKILYRSISRGGGVRCFEICRATFPPQFLQTLNDKSASQPQAEQAFCSDGATSFLSTMSM